MTVDPRQSVAFPRQVGVKGAQERLLAGPGRQLTVTQDVVGVEVLELEQEPVAVESAGCGEIARCQGRRSPVVKQDDQVAGLAVERDFLPAPRRPAPSKKMPLEREVTEVLHEDQALSRLRIEYARDGSADRFEDPVVAEQGG